MYFCLAIYKDTAFVGYLEAWRTDLIAEEGCGVRDDTKGPDTSAQKLDPDASMRKLNRQTSSMLMRMEHTAAMKKATRSLEGSSTP